MRYRVSWPLWRLAYRLGCNLSFKVSCRRLKADPQFWQGNKPEYVLCGKLDDVGFIFEAADFTEFTREALSIAAEYVEYETNLQVAPQRIALLPFKAEGGAG